ncbi:unnamed protein product [Owenia fusiformis]|uniref:Uncharacterized protein n=1 Tax=Owenia fusiformis TaxID=6347 RepID=A0A8S4PS05_OWEFU|nr:unnamed protein product [Owenia fusiformis]
MCLLDKDCRRLLLECSACVSFGACVVLVVMVIGFAPPYLRGSSFVETVCVVISTTMHHGMPCKCGRWYEMDRVPCIQIIVTYHRHDTGLVHNVTLHKEYTERGCSVSVQEQCSYGVCTHDIPKDTHALELFQFYYGVVGRGFRCYYDPNLDRHAAYLDKPNPRTVIHMVAWPTGFLLAALSVCAFMLVSHARTRWRLCMWYTEPDIDDDTKSIEFIT